MVCVACHGKLHFVQFCIKRDTTCVHNCAKWQHNALCCLLKTVGLISTKDSNITFIHFAVYMHTSTVVCVVVNRRM